MTDLAVALPYGAGTHGQSIFCTSGTSAVLAYSPWDDTTVTAAAGGSAGTTPPAPVVAAGSTNCRGSLTCGTGSGSGAGPLVQVSFGTALPATPTVLSAPTTNAAGTAVAWVTSVSSTAFTISAGAPTGSQGNTVYGFSWYALL